MLPVGALEAIAVGSRKSPSLGATPRRLLARSRLRSYRHAQQALGAPIGLKRPLSIQGVWEGLQLPQFEPKCGTNSRFHSLTEKVWKRQPLPQFEAKVCPPGFRQTSVRSTYGVCACNLLRVHCNEWRLRISAKVSVPSHHC